jgi:hypothetical protein
LPRYSFQVITDLAVSTPHPWCRGHCEGTDRSHPLNVGCLDIDQEEVSGAPDSYPQSYESIDDEVKGPKLLRRRASVWYV